MFIFMKFTFIFFNTTFITFFHILNFYKKQTRLVLGECGEIDPEDINEYIANDRGYWAARKAFLEMEPEDICNSIIDSGLRGRGGGGFPTGRKWALTLKENNVKKYVICNGDEGDPGAFMNRRVLEGDPHAVIEFLEQLGWGSRSYALETVD